MKFFSKFKLKINGGTIDDEFSFIIPYITVYSINKELYPSLYESTGSKQNMCAYDITQSRELAISI